MRHSLTRRKDSLTRKKAVALIVAVGVASLVGGVQLVAPARAADKPGPKVPAAPTDLKAHWAGTDANGRPAGVILTWNAVAGALRYNVYSGVRLVPQTTASTTLLAPNVQTTAYVDAAARMGIDTIPVYQVTAVNAAGESAKSNVAEPTLPTTATPVVIQGTVIKVSGHTALVKTPDRGPDCPPGTACPQFIILGPTFTVDTSNALFETADGTPAASQKLTLGHAVVIAGLKDPSLGSDTRYPLLHAIVVELAATAK